MLSREPDRLLAPFSEKGAIWARMSDLILQQDTSPPRTDHYGPLGHLMCQDMHRVILLVEVGTRTPACNPVRGAAFVA